jgi:hypothetical protein
MISPARPSERADAGRRGGSSWAAETRVLAWATIEAWPRSTPLPTGALLQPVLTLPAQCQLGETILALTHAVTCSYLAFNRNAMHPASPPTASAARRACDLSRLPHEKS